MSCAPATPSAGFLKWWYTARLRRPGHLCQLGRTAGWICSPGAVMSLQAVKAVELGQGVTAAESLRFRGSWTPSATAQKQIDGSGTDQVHPRTQQCRGRGRRHLKRGRHYRARLFETPFPPCAGRSESVSFATREVDQGGLRAFRRVRRARRLEWRRKRWSHS